MKKSTLILLGVAAALAIVVVLTTGDEAPPLAKSLVVPGYATPAQLEEEKNRKLLDGPLEIDHPIDEIILTRGDETVHLHKEGSGKETRWRMSAPVEGVAVKYLVEKICTLFKTDTASAYSTTVKAPTELGYYDLEPERRVGLTLKSKGEVYQGVDLWVGATVTADEPAPGAQPEADTWVMRKDDPTTVYRIVGKDLRTPVDVKLDELRDKRVFSNRLEDIVEVKITPPGEAPIVLTGTRKETAAATEKEPAKIEVDWTLTEPAGVPGDASLSSVARGLTTLRAQAFVPAAEAPKDALGEQPWVIEAKLHDGGALKLRVAATGDKEVWAQVEGRDELLKLNQYSARNLRKRVADLKDKVVLSVDKDAIEELTLQHEETGAPLTLVKGGDGRWRFSDPKLDVAADPASLLGAVSRLPAVRWAHPEEVAQAREALAHPDIRGGVRAGNARYALVFSKVLSGGDLEGKRWGVVGDPATAEPFLINDYAAKRLVTTPDKLRLKKVFIGRTIDDITRLEIRAAGATNSVVIERPAGGGDLTLSDVPEGKTVQGGALRTAASTFAALTIKAFHDDKRPADVGLDGDKGAKVIGRFRDGQEVTLRISEKTDEGAPFATIDGGPQAGKVFTLNSYQVKNLLKGPDELMK